MKPRWKRVLATVNEQAGEALGQMYVQVAFPAESKAKMEALVANLGTALKARIEHLEWMGEDTKAKALAKQAAFTPKIGYPDKWREWAGLETSPDSYIGNVLAAQEFNYRWNLSKIGQPVDKSEWGMPPQMVNAYYNPLQNEIVFPAAILQPPFFDPSASDEMNYGGIGAVIGHEISHGFDDQGRKFDGKGVLRDWWTDKDNELFMARANALVQQYNAFSPIPGMNVNGELTLGENIGDLSGLAVARKAYQIALDGKTAPVLDGFTGEQRFYLGWGQVWARNYRDDELRKRLKTDPHSPSEYRANGILRNMPDFAKAFDVKEGDKMYLAPEQAVRIW